MISQEAERRPPAIEARGLTIDYKTATGVARAVHNLDFAVSHGERFILLGPSGCGKSSILRAVAGFTQLAEGVILVDGRPLAGPGPDRVLVFQEFDQLLPWKTVLDNVAFPLRAARGLSRTDARERAAAALAKVGLSGSHDSYPHALSGGMKQRAAIARALASEAPVILMDEPFAALDAVTRRRLQFDLLSLAEELGFTLLFVTHSMDEAILIGQRLLLLDQKGASIGVYDASRLDARDANSLRAASRDVHRLLFGAEPEAIDALPPF
jgi:NitT/TauT family transport system ATP-binding protein